MIQVIIASVFCLNLLVAILHAASPRKTVFILNIIGVVAFSTIILLTIQTYVALLFFLGMVFSFVGDLFMAKWIRLTGKRLIDGIIGFSIAHLFYIIAIHQLITVNYLVFLAAILIFSMPMYFLIVHDPTQKLLSRTAFGYIVIISGVLISGISLVFSTMNIAGLVLITGIVLFVMSDSMIGVRQFRSNFPHSEVAISLTYTLGQLLIQSFVIFY